MNQTLAQRDELAKNLRSLMSSAINKQCANNSRSNKKKSYLGTIFMLRSIKRHSFVVLS